MTDFSPARPAGFSFWGKLSRLLAPRTDKRGKRPRNPQMFIDRETSRLPPHMLRDIGLFDGWPK